MDLTPEEVALAADVLETAYRDLKEEIYKTEGYSFKNQLKNRQQLLESLLRKFSVAARP